MSTALPKAGLEGTVTAMAADTILVTGATGAIGGRIADLLTAKEVPLRVMGRSLAKLSRFSHAEQVAADYSDTASLDRAFQGVCRAFIVSGSARPHNRARLHRNAFEAAKRAQVGHVVYLSFLGASPDSLFPMSQDHYESQQYLAETGLSFTALQDSFYAELAAELFAGEGLLNAPAGDGAVSWVGRDEVAEAVSNLLAAATPMRGIVPMTGPKAYTLAETAEVMSRLTGKACRYQEQSLNEARAARQPLASEPWEVDVWVGSYQAIAAGEVAAVTNDLSNLLGRPASDLETYLARQ